MNGVLLAVKSGHTRRQAARSALESLRQVVFDPWDSSFSGLHFAPWLFKTYPPRR